MIFRIAIFFIAVGSVGEPPWGAEARFESGLPSCKSALYTVKVRLLESIFTRYMALFKVPWCLALETSLKRPRQET